MLLVNSEVYKVLRDYFACKTISSGKVSIKYNQNTYWLRSSKTYKIQFPDILSGKKNYNMHCSKANKAKV